MSKNVLFYFSGTGNSLAAARSIAGNLEDPLVVPILKADAAACIEADTERIGLIYPIYMNSVPRAFAGFVKGLTDISDRYVFAVATHGGLPGKAGMHMRKLLEDRNIVLDAYYEVEFINNTPKGVAPKPLMRLNWELDITPEIVRDKLKSAEASIAGIVRSVLGKEQNTAAYKKGITYWFMEQLWKMNEKAGTKLDFILDDNCTGCGLCEKVCTTNRIKLREGKPQWTKDDCNYCYACFNFCPAQAIGVKHYTKKLGRYHHPDVTAADISGQLEAFPQEEPV